MSKEEKEKYNIEGIATLFRNVMLFMALVIAGGFIISKILEVRKIETIALFAAILIGLPYLLIKSNSDKYKIK